MRTTLEIDNDILVIAKNAAADQGTSVGRVISQLARKGLELEDQPRVRNGVKLFVPTKSKVKPDLELVNRLRDEQ